MRVKVKDTEVFGVEDLVVGGVLEEVSVVSEEDHQEVEDRAEVGKSTDISEWKKEGSHSGLVRIPGKDVCPKGHQEFESLTLRNEM